MNIIRFSISEAYHSRLAMSLMPLMKPRNAWCSVLNRS